jgi:LL-diaminopimelate aminotransferase
MKTAARLSTIPPYLFLDLDARIRQLRREGADVINLGVGDPDLPTPAPVVARLRETAGRREFQVYPDYSGSLAFRTAVARYYARRHGVACDPEREVLGLIGSKEGIAHLTWALCGPGDVVLIPEPAYPVYRAQALLAGAEPVALPLRAETSYQPNLGAIPSETARRARVLWLNYPHNPTGAVAGPQLYREALAFCRDFDIVLASDLAYGDVGLDGYRAPSALHDRRADDPVVEFFSLSKPYAMTGFRLAAAVGALPILDALRVVKSNTDSGQFTALQEAGIRALEPDLDAAIDAAARVYRRRRDMCVDALRATGLQVEPPSATFYLWVKLPDGVSESDAVERFLSCAGVVVSPGTAFGREGAGFIRLSLTVPDARIEQACRRIADAVRF